MMCIGKGMENGWVLLCAIFYASLLGSKGNKLLCRQRRGWLSEASVLEHAAMMMMMASHLADYEIDSPTSSPSIVLSLGLAFLHENRAMFSVPEGYLHMGKYVVMGVIFKYTQIFCIRKYV
jgi:hypothetical protein